MRHRSNASIRRSNASIRRSNNLILFCFFMVLQTVHPGIHLIKRADISNLCCAAATGHSCLAILPTPLHLGQVITMRALSLAIGLKSPP